MTGSLDDRVPLDYVKTNASRLSAMGANVTMQELGDANHFAFFSHREQVTQALETWLRQHGVSP